MEGTNIIGRTYALLWAANRPMTSAAICRAIGCCANTGQSSLSKLHKDGLILKLGKNNRDTSWIVANRKIKELPERRGKSPGSLLALRTYGGGNGVSRKSLRNLRGVKLTPDGKIIPQPKPSTALERAWGWIPSVSMVDG